MPKLAREMSAIEVRKFAAPGVHFVGGVSGLALRINDGSGRSWILRTTVGAKRRDIGLGDFPDVSLAAAREIARKLDTSAYWAKRRVRAARSHRSPGFGRWRVGLTAEVPVFGWIAVRQAQVGC